MRQLLGLLIIAALVWLGFLVYKKFDRPEAPWPTSGQEHPFYDSIDDLTIAPSGATASRAAAQAPKLATNVRSLRGEANVEGRAIPFVIEATPEVSKALIDNLVATLRAVPFEAATSKELEAFYGARDKAVLLDGKAEVRLPAPMLAPADLKAQRANQRLRGLYFAFPDNWVMVRPGVIGPNPDYTGAPTPDRDTSDVGLATAALTGSWSGVRGRLQCQPPGEAAFDLPFVSVTINDVTEQAGPDGRFQIDGAFTDVTQLMIRYDGRVAPVAGVAAGPRISVMNDFHNPRPEHVDIAEGETDADGYLAAVIAPLASIDCELFALGAEALQAYHVMTGLDPSAADDLRIKRWTDIHDGTPHAYYDYVAIANNWRTWAGRALSFEERRSTIYHEFGHTLRHADDGDSGHWGWDNFRWAYARSHAGNEIYNEHYAFNEGWGQFWECTRAGAATDCPGGFDFPHPDTDGLPGFDEYVDWVELMVGARLVAMSRVPDVGPAEMARLSRDNPGVIHTLREFETRYCARFRDNAFCNAGVPRRDKASCPPTYHDDGATCRQDNILAKESFGRGVGTVPTRCAGENDAGLCYTPCPPGFDGVGPVCWRRCPPGMHDDGAFCRRDVNIIGSDNSRCPWYDVCGLTFERGCSTCPAGFQNDGCTCRVDAWIFAKESFGRGAGTVPTDCGPGRQYDAGLCYPRCRPGFNGVGPVCWGSCPAGYADHGATCYRDPQVIVKY
jgi:hypothetical protein